MTWTGYTLPTWAMNSGVDQTAQFPQVPFLGVLAGQRQPFNPGGAFGQGGNVLPSIQRWKRLAPSEQAGYQGYLSDQLGVYPQDVMDLMSRLVPKGTISATPRWAIQ